MQSSSMNGRRGIHSVSWMPILITFLAVILPVQATAQDGARICSPFLDVDIVLEHTPIPTFDGDLIRVNVELGNSAITGGTHQEFTGFGYALQCQSGEDFSNCSDAGHKVSYQGAVVTDCVAPNGEAVNFAPQETSVALVVQDAKVVKLGPGKTCNVSFDVLVEDFDMPEGAVFSEQKLRQASGWPITVGGKTFGSVCYNDDEVIGSTSHSSSISVLMQDCAIDIEKQISIDGGDTWFNAASEGAALQQVIGGTAMYKAVVTNTGTISYESNITVTDPLLGSNVSIAGPARGASIDVPLPITSTEFSKGMCVEERLIENTATVDAVCRSPRNLSTSSSASDSAFLNCFGNPSIAVVKGTSDLVAGPFTDGPVILAGLPVYWQYAVTNDGDLPLVNVDVSDDQGVAVTCDQDTLAVNETIYCTASGTAVVDGYSNIGTAVGETALGVQVDDSDTSSYFGAAPAIDIVKTATPMTYDEVGDAIVYTFLVTNTGNVALTDVAVSDPLTGLDPVSCSGWPMTAGNPAGTLEPGESVNCAGNAAYLTTQADLDLGQVDNTATASGNAIGGAVKDTDTETVPGVQSPAIQVLKSADPMTFITAGNQIQYSFVVTNIGNVTLNSVYIADDKVANESCGTWPDTDGVLMPGESVDCTADKYTILAGDVTAESVKNTVVAYGTAPAPDSSTVQDDDSETVTLEGTPAVSIVKTADPTTYSVVGDIITYSFLVTNTGNVPLDFTDYAEVLDQKLDDAGLTIECDWETGEVSPILTAGKTIDCEVDYPVDQDDLDRGFIHNTASTTADDGRPGIESDPVTDEDNAEVNSTAVPSIVILKEISVDGGVEWADANETTDADTPAKVWPHKAMYRITVTNDGPLTLTKVNLFDDTLWLGAVVVPELAPDDVFVITGDSTAVSPEIYNVDLNKDPRCESSGEFINVAKVTAETKTDPPVPVDETDSAVLVCVGEPDIQIVKEVRALPDGEWTSETTDAMDAPVDAEYRITVENIGTVDLKDVVVTDDDLKPPVDFTIGDLAQGEKVTLVHSDVACTPGAGEYDVCELLVLNRCESGGTFMNTATVTGYSVEVEDPDGEAAAAVIGTGMVTDSDDATLLCSGQPLIEIVKEITTDKINWFDANDEANALIVPLPEGGWVDVWYRLKVTNIGPVELVDVLVTDGTLGVSYPVGNLASGAEVTIDSGDVIELEQLKRCEHAGTFANTATANGFSVATGAEAVDGDAAYLICTGNADILLNKKVGVCVAKGSDECTQCEGGVNYAKIAYKGSESRVTVTDKKGVVFYDSDITPLTTGGEFILLPLIGETRLDNSLFLTGAGATVSIHMSCSQPFGPGLIVGDFEVLDGSSRVGGGNMCPADEQDDDSSSGKTCAETGGCGKDKDKSGLETWWYGGGDHDSSSEQGEAECYLGGNDDSGSDSSSSGGKVCAETGGCKSDKDKQVLATFGGHDDDSDSDDRREGVIRWYDVTPGMQPPQDAWYKILVTNIGTSDLEDVVLNDHDLGIFNYELGYLAVGEDVLIDQNDPNVGGLMFWPERCTTKGEYVNLAEVEGYSVEEPYPFVFSGDTATLVCDNVSLCVHGKPKVLKVEYDGDPDTKHGQSPGSVLITPDNPQFPDGKVNIVVTDQKGSLVRVFTSVDIGDELRISGYRYRKASKLTFKIYENYCSKDDDSSSKKGKHSDDGADGIETFKDDDSKSSKKQCLPKAPIQKIMFSVNCDEPMNVGDEFGAITIVE